jgi:hypothetical protein
VTVKDQIHNKDADGNVIHESPHDALVLTVRKQLTKLKTKSLLLPEGKEQEDKFKEALNKHLLAPTQGRKIDVL